ncbi:MAG: TIM barrel protein [Spirochaetia bacterium]|jgi:xylose isomerase
MKDLKVSVGMWYMGATGDRFVKAGYRPDRTIEERFDAAGKIPGVGGLEMHYPTEINDKNWKDLKKRAADMNLKFVMLTPHLWIDPVYKFGQFSNPDKALRRRAVDFAKKVTDLGGELGVKFMCYWPAQDGYDYPFQVDFPRRWDTLAEGLAEWADYNKKQQIVVEYKAYDPRSHILLPNVGQTVTLLNEINRPNLGINIETGHALIMQENLAETFAFAMRYKRLFHTHWNDNSKMYDDDAMVGMVNLWETVELLFWLEELGYGGWFGLDLFPFREMPEDAVAQSIANIRMGYTMLERVDRNELRACFASSDAIKIAQLMRRMLGEKAG